MFGGKGLFKLEVSVYRPLLIAPGHTTALQDTHTTVLFILIPPVAADHETDR